MAGKRSNGEGSISYDSRRKKYRAKVTIGWEFDEENGKMKQKTKTIGSNFKTKGEASKALADYLDSPYNIDKSKITFSELYDLWFPYFIKDHQSHEYRIKAAYQYCSTLYNKKFRDITILDMKNVINSGTRPQHNGENKGEIHAASPQTKESIKYIFNHMYDYALEARITDINYARNFFLDKKVFKEKEANKKPTRAFTEEELQTLWRGKDFVPFADMILYACYSGWRPTELVSLKMENVYLKEGYIKGGIKTNAGKNRIVPICPLVKNIVEKYYNSAREVGSEYLFNDITRKNGIKLSYDQYLSRFHNVINKMNLDENLTPHSTRHTFITRAKSRQVNMNEYILKLIVGHKSADITEDVYTHRNIEDLIYEMNKIKS